MASTIQLKTGTSSAVPSSLSQGEIGINVDNGLFYYGSGSGADVKQLESFTHITASGHISASGVIYGKLNVINTSLNSLHYPRFGLSGDNSITSSGNISSSGNIYSDNIEILSHGSARVSTITNVTQYWGASRDMQSAEWNAGHTEQSTGTVILDKYDTTTGYIIPYSCSLVGFDAITRMNSGEDTPQSMSLFYVSNTDFDMDRTSGNQLVASGGHYVTASLAVSAATVGGKDYNAFNINGTCDVPLSPLTIVFPMVKVHSAPSGSGADGWDESMAMDISYVIKIKRVK